MTIRRLLLACTVPCALAGPLALPGSVLAAPQGVTRDEVVLGSIQDLSGPLAPYGRQLRMGMQLRADEINEQGGLHGRRLRLVIEDSAYDPKRAVLAAQKLVNQDRVFAVAATLGTATNNAAVPVQLDRGVPNFLPMAAAREMYEPAHPLKYGYLPSYHEQMRLMAPMLAREKGLKQVCSLTQDDEFGLEVLRGAEDGFKAAGLAWRERTTFKRGATDFSSQVAKLKAAGCELVVLGTIIRETVGAMAEARKIGFGPVFVASMAAYSDLIHKLGGPAVDGLYAAMSARHPYADDPAPALRFWAAKYRTRFGEEPTVLSAYGYSIVDLFGKAVLQAGPALTTESFVRAMDGMSAPPDLFGSPEMTWSAKRRLGSNQARLSRIVDGRWQVVGDYLQP